MGERLTQGDIDKIKKEIEYRTLVVRKEAIEAVSEEMCLRDRVYCQHHSLSRSLCLQQALLC